MYIQELKLVGYKRLLNNGIESFVMRPNKIMQLILGTNGSGKSSLMDEITPLPSNSNDYSKNGYSEKHITRNNNTYVLKSTFSPSQKYSFVKNDVELNLGGTITVQKELVKQEFNITPDIHEVLIGRDKFTNMSPSSKRQWFTELSNTSYDYAIRLYNKLRERHRDIVGAIKQNKSRLVTESSKLLSTEEQEKLLIEVNSTHELLNVLLEYRKPLEHIVGNLRNDYNVITSEIINLATTIIKKVRKCKSSFQFNNASEITEKINDDTANMRALVITRDNLYKDFEKVKESLDLTEQTGNKGITELKNRIEAIKLEQSELLNKKKMFLSVHDNPINAINSLASIHDVVTNIFLEIPDNSDMKYSRDTMKTNNEKLVKLQEELLSLNKHITTLEATKTHQESHKTGGETECPNCRYKWVRGFNKRVYEDTVKDLESSYLLRESRNKEIKSITENIKEIEEYFSIYRNYRNIQNSFPILSTFWDHVLNNDLLIKNPRKLALDIEIFKSDLFIDKSIRELDKEITHINELILISQKVGIQDIAKLKEKLEYLEKSIYDINLNIVKLNTEIKLLQLYSKDVEDIYKLTNSLSALDNELQTNTTDQVETLRRTYLNDAIRNIQSSLARKEEVLREFNTQKSIISNIETNIKSMEYDEICLKNLVNQLSPTDGLIAEGLFGFIRLFVFQMNTFIRKVWSYEMEIQPCQLSDDNRVELDYRFPIKLKNGAIVADVNRGSSGMKEIIDLAFKVTAMKYLGVDNTPLMLDEFAASFDSAHRASSLEMIKSLMDKQPFTQLFIVNHYNSIYGALTNAEICILCDNNIDIPKDSIYNRHVEIVKSKH
jgi:ABC-type Mn2+/Zn2+ transport system ATPase subunit